MTIAGGWLLVPLAFAGLCGGIGLLVEAALRARIPGALLPGVGLAGLIVLAGLLTILSWTAPLAAPVCIVAAAGGLAVGRPWNDGRLRTGAWAALCALLAFAVASAPSWLSGQFSVLGFGKLDDTAIWLAITDHVMSHGRDLADLPPSSYGLTLKQWLGDDYPIGSFTPLGVVAWMTGQDPVNAYQPVISGYVSVCALSLYACARELAGSPRRAAACALIAVQASLFLGYVAWGSIKEICVAALLATLAAVRPLPLAGLVAAAVICAFGIGAVVLVVPALAGLGLLAWRRGERVRAALAGGAVLAVGAVPVLIYLTHSVQVTLHGAPSLQNELGKLTAPLERLQGAGLWPAGDFRDPPDPHALAVALAVLGLVLAAAALVHAVRRSAWSVPLLLATAGIGGTVAIARGAPWIDAKVMAITSALVLCASAAAVAAARRPVAAAGLVVIAGFSAWSTALVLRDVFVAPRSELAQQRSIGRALEGHGPTLVLSFEGLANRYLFAPARAEGASDARSHVVTDRAGTPPADFTTVEMGDVDPKVFASFNAILRRRTPVGSWAPADFRPFATTTGYESWLRVPGAPAPLADLPLGSGLPAGVPDCAAVRQLAATPGATTLAAAPRANPVLGAPGQLTVPTTGVWRAWVQGETLGRLEVRIDGVSAGSYRHRIVATGGWLRFGARRLAAGPHTVTLRSERGAFWRAGRGTSASQPPLGGVALSPESPQTVERMPVERARRLCDGRSYDWIEALP